MVLQAAMQFELEVGGLSGGKRGERGGQINDSPPLRSPEGDDE